jgi:hypothetical protein
MLYKIDKTKRYVMTCDIGGMPCVIPKNNSNNRRYTMMEERKKRAITRLESSALVRPLVNKMYMEGAEAAAEGRPVAWLLYGLQPGDAGGVSGNSRSKVKR